MDGKFTAADSPLKKEKDLPSKDTDHHASRVVAWGFIEINSIHYCVVADSLSEKEKEIDC
ncbi:hypothetical protein ACLOJK_003274 [Asimina triloba]